MTNSSTSSDGTRSETFPAVHTTSSYRVSSACSAATRSRVAATACCTASGSSVSTSCSPPPCPGRAILPSTAEPAVVCPVTVLSPRQSWRHTHSNQVCAFEPACSQVRMRKPGSDARASAAPSCQLFRCLENWRCAVIGSISNTGQRLAADPLQPAHHIVAATAEVVVQLGVLRIQLVVSSLGPRVGLVGADYPGAHRLTGHLHVRVGACGHRCMDRRPERRALGGDDRDRKSTRLNSSHVAISYAVFCLKKKIMLDNLLEAAKCSTERGWRGEEDML